MAFEHKTETEARQQILDMVAEYAVKGCHLLWKDNGETG